LLYLSDDDVAALVSPGDALDAVRDAFTSFGRDEAAVQRRERTDAGGVKLSTLGAVVPSAGVLGAKVYSTVDGQFTFVVVLFAADDGRRLAVLESGVLTQLRTAATSVLSTQLLHGSDAVERVVVFGSGTQGRGHVAAFSDAFGDVDITTVGRSTPADELEKLIGAADVVVTATRATTPVLSGRWLGDDVHVCAVGTSRIEARELDASVYERASVVAVEWRDQARLEAGGLVQAVDAGVLTWDDVVELGAVTLDGFRRELGRGTPSAPESVMGHRGVTVFQSVGIGLEDVAVAAVAWGRAVERGAGMRSGGDDGR
jgi:ornithine cyclodeaminase